MSRDTPKTHSLPLFSSSYVYVKGGTFVQGTLNYNVTDRDSETLKELKHHSCPDALHTSEAVSRQNMCTPGTRTDTLRHLRTLATSPDPDSPDIIWMHGPAGAGKSAIMRTLANDLNKQGLLLASFFFLRPEGQRNTSRCFIPTIAARVWDVLPATRAYIAQAVQDNHDLFTRPAHGQSPLLLVEPIVAAAVHGADTELHWTKSTPITVIVDGLGECAGAAADVEGQTEIVNAMIQLASSIRTRTNRRIKIFVASRPEYQIESTFTKSAPDANVMIIRLTSDDAEIGLFYEEQIDKIREKFRLPPSWPSQDDIEWLMKKSSGQYPFPSASTRFMHSGDPMGRLKVIREGLKDDKLKPFETLDQLYAAILNQIPEDMRTPALLVLRCRLLPMWITGRNVILEPIFRLPRDYIRGLRPYLSSLIDFDDHLSPYHASLADFLVGPSRSRNLSLHIDDRALSYAIQRGMLAVFGEQDLSNYHEVEHWEHQFCAFANDEHTEILVPHPLPSAELFSALRKVNPSSLTLVFSNALHHFLKVLQQQFLTQHLYVTRPVVWYTIQHALPAQIRLEWERSSGVDVDCPEQGRSGKVVHPTYWAGYIRKKRN